MMLNNPFLHQGESHFFIKGPVGQLEALSLTAKNNARGGVAVICHPHPLHQGTMCNKVVHTLSRAFYLQGIHTLRFNYRGVGKSEGDFGYSEGEVADLFAVLNWLAECAPGVKLWLAGFSFGAYIAARGAQLYTCEQLYSVAPAVINQPYIHLERIPCPWIVIQGEQDEVVPPAEVYSWFVRQQAKQSLPMTLLKVAEASHFFHGKLVTLRELVQENCLMSV